MTPQEHDAILTDVSPGTPMHEAISRYWLPACLSRDMPDPDSDPVRVRMLGRDFVAFRDSSGKVGILNEHCCHRSASLCLARVEEGGIRCLYHGWKYDTEGNVLDMPNVRDERVKARIKQPSYPVREAGGIVWTYIGPRELEPPFQHLPLFDVPESQRFVEIAVASSNYTRALEGVLDSSHTGVLHSDSVNKVRAGAGPAPVLGGNTRASHGAQIGMDLAPTIETQDTDFGFRYAALRRIANEQGEPVLQARITSFAFPSFVYTPPGNVMLFALPVDTERTHFFMCYWDPSREIGVGEAVQELRAYYGIDDAGMTYWGLGRATHDGEDRPSRLNHFKQDRQAMREGRTFSGLHRFIPEDFIVAESMGPIANRPKENLVPADIAIARMRRLMVENALAVRDGQEPKGLNPKQIKTAGGAPVSEEKPWTAYFAEEEAKAEALAATDELKRA